MPILDALQEARDCQADARKWHWLAFWEWYGLDQREALELPLPALAERLQSHAALSLTGAGLTASPA